MGQKLNRQQPYASRRTIIHIPINLSRLSLLFLRANIALLGEKRVGCEVFVVSARIYPQWINSRVTACDLPVYCGIMNDVELLLWAWMASRLLAAVPEFGGGKAGMFLEISDEIVRVAVPDEMSYLRDRLAGIFEQFFCLLHPASCDILLIGDIGGFLECP